MSWLAAGALAMMALAAPVAARAENVTTEMVAVDAVSVDAAESLPASDELLDGYVNQIFYSNDGIVTLGTTAGEQLSANEKYVYDVLRGAVEDIASGERARTDGIELPSKSWDIDELGIDYVGDNTDWDPAFVAYGELYPTDRAFNALIDDCPFDLYWFDKTGKSGSTEGGSLIISYGMSFTGNASDGTITVTGKLSLLVAPDYRAGDDQFAVDASDVTRAQSAAKNARDVVLESASKGDYDKLLSYKDTICELVDYDTDSAVSPSVDYGDPWQLVNVFDGDAGTNVVCEGYAKAFQYLYDLSEFNSSSIRCITVNGQMSGGTGEGAHMWNVVQMEDGESYLVDVTNSDEGSVGQGGDLFLAGTSVTAGSGASPIYWWTIGSQQVGYVYSSSTMSLYPSSCLTIAASDYVPSAEPEPEPGEPISLAGAKVTVSGTHTYTGSPIKPAVTVTVDGKTVPSSAYTVSYSSNTNAGTARVTVSARANSGYEGTASTAFTIAKATPTVSVAYKGGAIYPSTSVSTVQGRLTVMASTGGTHRLNTDAFQVGTRDYTVTFMPEDTANYNTVTKTIKLTVSADSLVSIKVTRQPETTYEYGEALNKSGAVITATYASGRTVDVTSSASFSPSNLGSVGTKTVTVSFEGKTTTIKVNVVAKAMKPTVTLTGASGLVYNGKAHRPGVVVKDGSKTLPSSEYIVTYKNNVNAGTATLTVSDKAGGNYKLTTVSKTFSIAKAPVTITLPDLDQVADGKPIDLDASDIKVSGGDAKVSFAWYKKTASGWAKLASAPKDPGTYRVVVSVANTNANYASASKSVDFTISEPQQKPGTDKPSADKPGTDKPGIDKPSADKPGTDKPSQQAKRVTMYRLYNQWTGEHFYTASKVERDTLSSGGWTYEGVGWIAPSTGDVVWRLYNPFVEGGDHHYTMSESEYEALEVLGWKQEGLGWYSGGDVEVYRQYNPYATTGTHNYTTDKAENDALVALGWNEEGIGWMALAAK